MYFYTPIAILLMMPVRTAAPPLPPRFHHTVTTKDVDTPPLGIRQGKTASAPHLPCFHHTVTTKEAVTLPAGHTPLPWQPSAPSSPPSSKEPLSWAII